MDTTYVFGLLDVVTRNLYNNGIISTFFKIAYIFNYVFKGVSTVKCYMDETVGNRKGNVYYCDDLTKPECCEQNMKFTCCELEATRNLREQFILWGGVISVAVVITILLCCLCKDIRYCSTDTPVLKKLGRKRFSQDEDDEEEEEDTEYSSRSSSTSSDSISESPFQLDSPRYARSNYGRRIN